MLNAVIPILCVAYVSCSRILVVFPVPSTSHAVISDSIVKTLLDGGHNVTYISPFTKLKPSERLRHIHITSEDFKERRRQNMLDVVQNPPLPRQVFEKGVEHAKRALQHEAFRDILSDGEEYYDAVVAQWHYSGLLAPLAALYNCPLVWYTCQDASWVSLQIIHEQTNPAYSVDLLSSNVALDRSVWARAYRLWRQAYLTAMIHYTINYIESPVYLQVYEPLFHKRGVPLPDYETVLHNGSLLLINAHPAVGQDLPLPGNAKYVGGLHIEQPAKVLPEKLQQILDTSTKGVILFSFGTEISTEDLPLKMKWDLMDVFAQLEQTVIWKVDEYMEDLPKNVVTVKVMPQRNVLNHSNTVLFINQGGWISNIEAAYLGVPLISVPFYGDQFVSADITAAAGRGLRLDFCEQFPEKLKVAIEHVLGNDRYQKSARFTSSVLQNSLVSPSKELLHLVNLVISTKGAHHLRSPAVHLTIFQRLYLDVIALLFMLFWFLSKVVKVFQAHMTDDVQDDEERKNK